MGRGNDLQFMNFGGQQVRLPLRVRQRWVRVPKVALTLHRASPCALEVELGTAHPAFTSLHALQNRQPATTIST